MEDRHFPNPFDDFEVIAKYTDAQALEDGQIVAISRKDRVSRAVWEAFVEHAPKDAKPPNCWPVDMLGWFQAGKISQTEAQKMIAEYGADGAQNKLERMIADRKALALSKGIIGTHAKQANRVYEENIGGGIYKLFATYNGTGTFTQLETEDRGTIHLTLWLIPNECGGITLLFPEDY